MDTCIWKPIVVTCSADKTIRIWNYKENFVEVIKKYEYEPVWLVEENKYIFSNHFIKNFNTIII